jgi:N-acyl-D-amino-acid deacylase
MSRVGKVALVALVAGFSLGAAPAREQVDLIVRGGTVYTGSDAPFVGDVAISGDRIRAVGPHVPFTARRVIDAAGMIVAPGFIDPHTHVGGMLASDDAKTRLVLPFLMQGVTTAFINNDGGGSLDLKSTLTSARTKPVGINYAAYVGFGSVREKVIGEGRGAPTAAELVAMQGIVAKAMCEGALGISTGLFYAPQSFSTTEEVIAVTRAAARAGGIYDTHMRDESSYTVGLKAAVDEVLRIGREAHIPVHISHIKALGVDVQGQAPLIIAKVDAARRAGQKVTANQYPWSASGTSLVASLVPLWAQDGGRAALLKRFDDPSLAHRLHADMAENLRKRGGADKLLITEGPEKGRTLAQVAKRSGADPVDAAIATIRIADPATVSFNMGEADIAAFMRQPWVMTGSDASTGHPRVYGSFARKYAVYVKQKHVITLRQFIERSSTLAADTFGLGGRGHLHPGAFADLVVFDPKTYAARATYERPAVLATGVQTVLVNGRIAVDKGEPTGTAAGRALPHKPAPGACPSR